MKLLVDLARGNLRWMDGMETKGRREGKRGDIDGKEGGRVTDGE